jgi:hypothetical protein
MNTNILVISDSHKDHKTVGRLLDAFAAQIEFAVHLGDNAYDLIRFEPLYPGIKIKAVDGNCDPGTCASDELIFEVNGRRVLLTHGHNFNNKLSLDRLMYYAEEKEVAVCLFGHTHRPTLFERGPVLFFNPGSLGEPPYGCQPSYGLLSVSAQGVFKGKIITL